MTNQLTTKSLFSQQNIKAKFEELMGAKAQGFITSVLQVVNSNDLLSKADPMTVYNAAATAAVLDLPINNSLGFAYIVPYKGQAQFQIGYKGLKQLALRSGQFKTINSTDVREGELKKRDRLTGEIEFEWIQNEQEREKAPVIGYVNFFELLYGYSQTFYMSVSELDKHGKKYSQTYKKGFGNWKDDFESMCLKTVTKLNLSKNAPLSIAMQKAIISDQAVINNAETEDVSYVDNSIVTVDKEDERVLLMISDANTLEDLENIGGQINMTPEQIEIFNEKKEALKNGRK